MAPLNPNLVTQRSNSATAATGSGVGSAAKAANRSGWAPTMSYSRSLALRASLTEVSASPRWVDGAPWDSTWKSIPASSISWIRNSL